MLIDNIEKEVVSWAVMVLLIILKDQLGTKAKSDIETEKDNQLHPRLKSIKIII